MAVLHRSRVLVFQVIEAHPPCLYVTLFLILFQLEDQEAPLNGEDSDDKAGVPEEAEEPLAPPAGQAPELGPAFRDRVWRASGETSMYQLPM